MKFSGLAKSISGASGFQTQFLLTRLLVDSIQVFAGCEDPGSIQKEMPFPSIACTFSNRKCSQLFLIIFGQRFSADLHAIASMAA